jgi:hypothetical protein
MGELEDLIAKAGANSAGLRKLRDLRDPKVLEILNYWYAKRGDRRMPQPGDMDPVDFARHMPNLMMLQVDYEPFRLTYRLIGEEVAQVHGTNFRGRTVQEFDEVKSNLGSLLHELYKAVAMLQRPVGVGGSLEFMGKGHMTFEAAYMPLSFNGDRTDRLFTVTSYKPLSVADRFAVEVESPGVL